MSLEPLREVLPDYAKDLKLNLSNVIDRTSLTEQQLWGTLLASAIASRSDRVIEVVGAEARERLDAAAERAARAAAAVMAMNNVYYRFTHLVGDDEYASMPARLRMTVIGNPGVERLDFELWSLAVSAVNGCGRCIESHAHEVASKGATREVVQDVVRVAAVVHAVAATLDAEHALTPVAA
ncbi:MAG TPA: carboxymuconolactone decarboxylase family protein [Acidimicrobiia bacterium]|nr:carboxymuconolactone decarboxylase family protein [Acidimicrobiia bacterium]